MIRPVLVCIALACAALGAAACDESLSTIAGPSPNLQPTFASVQQNIFEATDSSGRTACTSCHTDAGRAPSSGLNLRRETAYAALVGVPSVQRLGVARVKPGDPENSYLIHKLDGRTGIVGTRMPRGTGPYLTDGQMLILRRWIERGAPND
jgi:hypothetical protein